MLYNSFLYVFFFIFLKTNNVNTFIFSQKKFNYLQLAPIERNKNKEKESIILQRFTLNLTF